MNVFDLFATITLDTSKYEQQLEDAGSKTGTFGEKLKSGLGTAAKIGGAAIMAVTTAATTMGAALIKGVSPTAQYGDNIDKMSQKMGMTAAAYQEWDAVMQHCGTSIESMQAGMKTLASAAETGNDALKKLGMSQETIAGMSQEELFSATITALQNVESETERTYLAGQLLGRGATELGALLNTSAEDTQAMKDRVHELGGVMSDEAVKAAAAYQDSLQDMKTSIGGIVRGITSEFMPGITSVMNGLTEIFIGNGDSGMAMISNGISDFTDKLSKTIPKITKIGTQIINGLLSAIVKGLPVLVNGVTSLIVGIVDVLPDLITMITDALPSIIETLVNALPALLPALISGIVALVVGIANALPGAIVAIVDALPAIIESICTAIIENAPILVQGMIQLVTGLASALPEIITGLLEALPDIIMMIANVLISNAGLLIEATVQVVFAVVAALPEIVLTLISAVVDLIIDLAGKIKEKWPEFKAAAEEWFRKLLEGIEETWADVETWAANAWSDFVGWCRDVGPKLKEAGEQVLDDLWSGLKEAWEAIKAWFTGEWDSLFETSTSASGKKIIHVNKPKAQGSHAAGLDYVPFDGYIAELHRGEMIVPAREAAALRSGKTSPDITVIQNIYSEAKTAADLMQEAMWEAERAVLTGV